jgi:hypothetical protein
VVVCACEVCDALHRAVVLALNVRACERAAFGIACLPFSMQSQIEKEMSEKKIWDAMCTACSPNQKKKKEVKRGKAW